MSEFGRREALRTPPYGFYDYSTDLDLTHLPYYARNDPLSRVGAPSYARQTASSSARSRPSSATSTHPAQPPWATDPPTQHRSVASSSSTGRVSIPIRSGPRDSAADRPAADRQAERDRQTAATLDMYRQTAADRQAIADRATANLLEARRQTAATHSSADSDNRHAHAHARESVDTHGMRDLDLYSSSDNPYLRRQDVYDRPSLHEPLSAIHRSYASDSDSRKLTGRLAYNQRESALSSAPRVTSAPELVGAQPDDSSRRAYRVSSAPELDRDSDARSQPRRYQGYVSHTGARSSRPDHDYDGVVVPDEDVNPAYATPARRPSFGAKEEARSTPAGTPAPHSHAVVATPGPATPATTPATPSATPTAAVTPADTVHRGLQNLRGENICFLNVVIQTLWHLPVFRNRFQSSSHNHPATTSEPCVYCELKDLFVHYEYESTTHTVKANRLQQALDHFTHSFPLGSMCDCKEALEALLQCVHSGQTKEEVCAPLCLAHEIFHRESCVVAECDQCHSTNVEPAKDTVFRVYAAELLAARQGVLRRPQSLNDFAATSIRESREVSCSTCQEQLKERKKRLALNMYAEVPAPETTAGKDEEEVKSATTFVRFCFREPKVFVVSLEWPTDVVPKADIEDMFGRIDLQIDLRSFYAFPAGEAQPPRLMNLQAMICYYGRHYFCYIRSHDCPPDRDSTWRRFDDSVVAELPSFDAVVQKLIKGHSYPVLLFYEEECSA